MKIIGIDPGLSSTGVGMVMANNLKVNTYSFFTIKTKQSESTSNRLLKIYNSIIDYLKKEKPDILIIEDIYFLPKYPKSGIILGKVCGVLLLAASMCNIKAIEIPPKEVKKVLTGNGKSSKKQLEIAVRHFLNCNEPVKPDHASDALALALTGLFRYI